VDAGVSTCRGEYSRLKLCCYGSTCSSDRWFLSTTFGKSDAVSHAQRMLKVNRICFCQVNPRGSICGSTYLTRSSKLLSLHARAFPSIPANSLIPLGLMR
jgi:hypothetical protein